MRHSLPQTPANQSLSASRTSDATYPRSETKCGFRLQVLVHDACCRERGGDSPTTTSLFSFSPPSVFHMDPLLFIEKDFLTILRFYSFEYSNHMPVT